MQKYMNEVKYEETFENQEETILEHYFIAPKELLSEFLSIKYPDAVSATILLKIPMDTEKPIQDAVALVSPTKETEEDCLEDYDWTEIDGMLKGDDIKKLLSLLLEEILEDAARQWCDFIEEARKRKTGEGFAEFFYDTLEQTGCKKYLSVVVLEDIEEFEKILEESCRQWCDFIDDAPERKTGEGFVQFFREIREQKL